jgi:hypothetical protein
VIKDIMSGPGIVVTGNFGTPYISPRAQSAGMTRYNTNTQNLEVYDGNTWLTMSTTSQVSLDVSTLEVVNWAKKKMAEESRLEDLMKKHPGLRDTYEKFELMKALCQKDEDNVTR